MERTTVWLLQYKDDDRPARLLLEDNPGPGIDWRSTKTIDSLRPGDPVLYWRGVNAKTGDRGGIVGTGRFTGELGESREQIDKKKKKAVTWHYYPTLFEELFPQELISRDDVISESGLELNWGFGSILEVPPEAAERIDALLKSRRRKGLFLRQRADAAPQIMFIGDAPKTNEDFLNRCDLAFVLAARLNRVWDETNRDAGVDMQSRPAPGFLARVRRILTRKTSSGDTGKDTRGVFDKSFVVHVDAPWGGGKTTFANYLVRILNPNRVAESPPAWLSKLPLDNERFWPAEFRRPWFVVSFNAWQHQHVDPPWWCFYQAIRRQCFHAVRTEKPAEQVTNGQRAAPQGEEETRRENPLPSRMELFRDTFLRHGRWLWLWMKELAWRIFTPKVQGLLLTFLLTVLAALLLRYFGMFDPNAYKNALKEGLKHSDLDTLVTTTVVVLFGGATAIWSVFAVLTDSLLPGTPDAARNYSLGSGDPLERFRLHFNRMAESLEQPILIAVDDIDRCEPRFVVALLQGIQTIFRSPRVVFVLLGDRDWIEQAFASVHSAMTGIDVGPEHTFGGRFVEKAIQLSLVLPAIGREGKGRYVRQLLGIRDEPQEEDESPLSKQEEQKVGEQLSDIVDMEDQLQREAEAASLRKRIQTEGKAGDPAKSEAIKQIDRQMALRSASDKTADDATRHRLIPIASVLPANPRQIKRIINGIALFQAIAQLEQQIQPGSADWCKLALWVVIMTEWPRTWATLSTYPGLLDRVRDPRGKATGALPDELRTDAWAAAIQDNEAIMQLLDFSSSLKTGRRQEEIMQSPDVVPDEGNWIEAKIDPSTIERFRAFMPAVGGKLLPDPAEESET